MSAIPRSKWKDFGHAGHFIGSNNCRFHLATLVGKYLISTVGDYRPRMELKEKPTEIGYGRTYETMVFLPIGTCDTAGCGCGLPTHDGRDLDMAGYNDAKAAAEGHFAMCKKWATAAKQARKRFSE